MTNTEVQDVREQICTQAQILFTENGIENTGLRAIAAQVDITATALYRYFPKGRDEILAAVRARAFEQFADVTEEAFRSDGPPLDRFRAMGRAHVAFARERTATYHMMFDFSQSGEFPDLREQAKCARDILFSAIEELARSENMDKDCQVLAHVIWAAMHGAVQLETSGQLKFGVTIEQLMNGICDMLFAPSESETIPLTGNQEV